MMNHEFSKRAKIVGGISMIVVIISVILYVGYLIVNDDIVVVEPLESFREFVHGKTVEEVLPTDDGKIEVFIENEK